MTNVPVILVYLALVFLAGFGAGVSFRYDILLVPVFDEPVEERVIELPLQFTYTEEGRWRY
jgi:hypothetical protein